MKLLTKITAYKSNLKTCKKILVRYSQILVKFDSGSLVIHLNLKNRKKHKNSSNEKSIN